MPEHCGGVLYPIHPLQIAATGMLASGSLDLENVAEASAAYQRWEFLVAASSAGDGLTLEPESHHVNQMIV